MAYLKIHNGTHTGDQTYKCEMCSKSFTQAGSLKLHSLTHIGEKQYVCQVCQKAFPRKDSLNKHLLTHTIKKSINQKGKMLIEVSTKTFRDDENLRNLISFEEMPHVSNKSQEKFLQKDKLQNHILTQSNVNTELNDESQVDYEEKKYTCHVCEKNFKEKADLEKHNKMHIVDQLSESEEKFSQIDILKNHVLIQSNEKAEMNDVSQVDDEEKNYTCPVCEKTFKDKADLEKHNKNHIVDQPSVSQEKFLQIDSLQNHVVIQLDKKTQTNNDSQGHNEEKKYKCDICKKAFKEMAWLRKHNRVHTGERPYKCEICSKSFTQMGSVKLHLLTHTKEKAFVCPECHKRFSQKGHLKSHLLIHTGEKLYRCEYCPRSFSRVFVLKRHCLTHTGKKHVCQECQKAFAQKDALNQHLLTHTIKKSPEIPVLQKGEMFFEIIPKAFKADENSMIPIYFEEMLDVSNGSQEQFLQKDNLENHILTHSNVNTEMYDVNQIHYVEKKYKCHVCEKFFLEKADLEKHNKLHIEDRASESQEQFPQKDNQKTHLLTQLNEKTEMSDVCHVDYEEKKHTHVCEESFKEKADIENHDKMHIKDGFIVSQEQFPHKDNLKNHILIQSNENTEMNDVCHKKEKLHANHECQMSFSAMQNFKGHLLNHEKKILYECQECKRVFPTDQLLKYHLLHNHRKKILHECLECKRVFPTDQLLKYHLLLNHEKKILNECQECKRVFSTDQLLKYHLLTHKNCKICSKSFVLLFEQSYFITQTGEKLYACLECEKTIGWEKMCQDYFSHAFVCQKNISVKQNAKQNPSLQHVCHECQKAFSQEDSLNEHLLSHYAIQTKAKPYISSVCQKTISVNQNVKQNLLTLTREELYICQLCQKSFSTMQNLKNHLLTHKTDKLHTCQECQKSFSTMQNLQKHLFSHEIKKVCECQECKIVFSTAEQLKYHLLTHKICLICSKSFVFLFEQSYLIMDTGEKLYVCSECEKAYGWKKLTQDFFSHASVYPKTTSVKQNVKQNHPSRKKISKYDNLKNYVPTQSNKKTEMKNIHQIDYASVYPKTTSVKQNVKQNHPSRKKISKYDNLKNYVLTQSNKKTEMKNIHQIDYEEKSYTCHVCEKTFKKKTNFEKHNKMHIVDRSKVNQKQFPVENNLKNDILTQSNEETEMNDVCQIDYEEKNYTCHACEETFKGKADLEKHNKIHVENRLNANQVQFPLKDNFKIYVLNQSNGKIEMNNVCQVDYEGKKYKCHVCEETFIEKADLEKHNKMHIDDQPYRICSKSFTQSDSLKTDLLMHTGEKARVCPVYCKEFSQKDGDQHLLTYAGKKLYKCAICPKLFTNSAIYRKHYLKHTGKEQHVCHECQKVFSQEDSLIEHLFSHFPSLTKAKPYISSVCQKTISVNQNVKQNLLILTREELYVCQLCQTSFSTMQNLKNHLLTHKKCIICSKSFVLLEQRYVLSHTGKKLYVCPECEKASGEKLTQHFFSQSEEEQYRDDIDILYIC